MVSGCGKRVGLWPVASRAHVDIERRFLTVSTLRKLQAEGVGADLQPLFTIGEARGRKMVTDRWRMVDIPPRGLRVGLNV